MPINELWEQVKTNHKKLRECEGHTFVPVDDTQKFNKNYKCTVCKGTIDSSAYYWYMQGREHESRIS